jgi:CxxC motif-containing protein (DUF1111 family)
VKRGFLLFSVGIFMISVWLSACRKTDDIAQFGEEDEQYSGGNATSFDVSSDAFGEQIKGATNDELNDFQVGNSFFRNNWVAAPASASARDGLGVFFNATSCGGCHFKDGRAAPPKSFNGQELSGLLFRLSVAGQSPHGEPISEPNYGAQLNDVALMGAVAEGKIKVSYQEIQGMYADGMPYSLQKPIYEFLNLGYGALQPNTMISPRIAQQIPGLGLLEAISESSILALADVNDSNGDGISGKPNYVWDYQKQQKTLGRFGWKANQPSLFQQTASALLGDMGITSSLFPSENLTALQSSIYGNIANGGSPEISDDNLRKTVFYIQNLAVPARRNHKDAVVLQGKQVFEELGCAKCHTPKMQTSTDYPVAQLRNQTIRPYTDMLLHDMGEGLADNRPDFEANGNEWRTPPLWGIGLINLVNKHTNFLHDGRARNLEEAILWHSGEGENSKKKFTQKQKADRDALIKFLESL